MKTKNKVVVIQDKNTGLYMTQGAVELWDDGHDVDGLDMWTDNMAYAAWLTPQDAPKGMDNNRFVLVAVK